MVVWMSLDESCIRKREDDSDEEEKRGSSGMETIWSCWISKGATASPLIVKPTILILTGVCSDDDDVVDSKHMSTTKEESQVRFPQEPDEMIVD